MESIKTKKSNYKVYWQCHKCNNIIITSHSNIPKQCQCGNTFFKWVGRTRKNNKSFLKKLQSKRTKSMQKEFINSKERIRKNTDLFEGRMSEEELNNYRKGLVISDLCERKVISKNKATRLRNKYVK